MSLIDPTTPEGFFHLRLVPYKLRLIAERRSLFPSGPERERESYFEEPSADATRVQSDPALLTAAGTLERLRAGWAAGGDSLLLAFSEPLEKLRQRLARREPKEGDEEISDFVYPLF